LSDFNGFEKINKETMEWVVKRTETLKDVVYHVNAPETLIKIERPFYPDMILKSEIKE
jgi:hypothetical protein